MKYHLISILFKIFWRNHTSLKQLQFRTHKKAAATEQPFCLSMYYSVTALQESNYLTGNIQLQIKSPSWYMNWNELKQS